MMTPGEKVTAVGMISMINVSMLLASTYLAAGTLVATLPLTVAIIHS